MSNPESSNIHSYIFRQHGREVLRAVRKQEKRLLKLARWQNHKHFNIRCHREQLIPPSLRLKTCVKGINATRIIRKTERRLIQERIRQCEYNIRILETEIRETDTFLRQTLSPETADDISASGRCAHAREFNVCKQRQRDKFDRFRQNFKTNDNIPAATTIDTNKWIINLSERTLSDSEKCVLKRGLNFCVATNSIPVKEIVASTEAVCTQIKDQAEADSLRSEVVKIIKKSKPPKSNISREEKQALNNLRQDNNIVILPADKGRTTVVLQKEEYHQKVQALLKDTDTYEKLKADPTKKIKNKIISLLKRWKKENSISTRLYQRLYPTSEVTPKLYGLPKIHKEDAPLRPIVSSCGSVTYDASKYLTQVLGPSVGQSEHHIINSVDFVKKLEDQQLAPGEILVSYDVCALFTSIPVPKALQVIKEKIEDDYHLRHRTELTTEQLLELLELCLTSTYFIYNGEFYQQKKGAAMGSPVSPVVANLYMEHFENLALKTATNPPNMWYRYVDDTMTRIQATEVENFTQHLNSIDTNIKFTSESETDGKISFLDTELRRTQDSKIETSVYRKPTHTDQYLNFQSNHPLQHKRSVVNTLLHRASVLCSTNEEEKKEKEHIKNALASNGYPPWMWDRSRVPFPSPLDKDCVKVGIPYVKGVSERLARTFSQHGCKVFHKPTNSLRQQLTHVKDKTDPLKQCGVVYQVDCSDCEHTYIGETARPLSTRIQEHQNRSTSAVHEHVQATGHSFSPLCTKILASDSHTFKRKVKEAIEIKSRRPSLNRDQGAELPPIYNQILSEHSSHSSTATPINPSQ